MMTAKDFSLMMKIACTIAVLVAIFALSNYLISIRAISPLSQYMGSTTARTVEKTEQATSTEDDRSSYDTFINSVEQMLGNGRSDSTELANYESIVIGTPTGRITALIADTENKRNLGLGQRNELGSSTGMLFVFDRSGTYPFWMKDMRFSLDFVWIDAQKRVVEITPNVSPDTYPNIVTSQKPIRYILEINAGAAREFGIVEGSRLDFEFN